jgi:hypothetical protein
VQLDVSRVNGTYQEQWRQRFEFDRRLRSALENQLIPLDAVELIAYGAAGCAVIGTSAGVLVYKRGIRAGIPFGSRLKPFEWESVVAINVRAIAEGTILAIHAPLKVGSCSIYWLDERDDPWKARNAVMAELGEGPRFEEAAVELRKLMTTHHARHGRATPNAKPRISSVASTPAPTPLAPTPAHRSCSQCGVEVEARWRFCPECGTSFRGTDKHWTWPRATHGAGH